MSTPYDSIPQQVADERLERFATSEAIGWTDFASLMLGIAGVWNIISGILAIRDSKVFTENATFVFSNLNTWGWIMTILGVLLVFAAVSVSRGGGYGRWVGIFAASINAIGQLSFVSIHPFWGITMFAVDIFIIYALVVYGGRKLTTN
ncbi:MAG TPA: hypothetical protein VFP31_02260 [Gaiellaceae bacterium]|nr:hypothetical protein [Gaiellaceae bacterium]